MPGTVIFLYRIPSTDGAALIPVTEGLQLTGIAFDGFFDPGASGRHLFFAVESANLGSQRIYWLNMDTSIGGLTTGLSANTASPLHLAPNGLAAWVQTDGTFAGEGTYHLIELCDDDLGTSINPSGSPWLDLPSPTATAHLIDNGGTWEAEIQHGSTTFTPVSLDDCQGAPPVVGACCDNGICIDGITQTACEDQLGGTWQGAGTTCAGTSCPPPPTPSLTVVLNGPSIVTAAEPVTYTVTWSNIGSAAATSVGVVLQLPGGTLFDSVDSGGVFYQNFNRIIWSIPSLAAGASGSANIVLRPHCWASQLDFTSCYIEASNSAREFASAIMTSVLPSSTAPATISVTKSVPAGEPLTSGDTVTYTFDLTNDDAQARLLNMNVNLGFPLNFDAVVDSSGGTMTTTLTSFTWESVVDPFQTRTVVVRGVLPSCRAGGGGVAMLNSGQDLEVRNACNATVGIASSIGVDVSEREIHSRIEVPGPPTIRVIGDSDGAWIPGGQSALIRPGDTVDATWIVRNDSPTTTNLDAVCDLGGMLPASDPPFIGTPPAGVSWDAAANSIAWSGTLVAGDSIVVHFQATDTPTSSCNQLISASITVPSCIYPVLAHASIKSIAAPWSEPHIVTLDNWGSLDRMRPGIDSQLEPWFCSTVEILHSLSAVGDGSYWLAGLPTFRFDPVTLDVAVLGGLPNLGLHNITVAVEDTVLNVVYLAGNRYVDSVDHLRIVAVDLTTFAVTDILNDTQPTRTWGSPDAMVLDNQGRLALTTRSGGLIQVDPADSTTVINLSEPDSVSLYVALTMHDDGRYLVPEYSYPGFSMPTRIAAVDPVTGQYEILTDLTGVSPDPTPIVAAAYGDSNRVYTLSSFGGINVIDLTTSPATVSFIPPGIFRSFAGLAFAPGGITTAIESEPDSGDIPGVFAFPGAGPNPFNPSTVLRFNLPVGGMTRLEIYDLKGRLINTLVDGALEAGSHNITWRGVDDDGRRLASGTYLARLRSGDLERTVKMVLAR
jgi:uncharacterized repeat protein (TIGR01451 family)